MQVTETRSDGLKRAYRVVMAAGDIEERLDERLRELRATVKLPGFRPGKAPVPLLRKRFGKSVMGEIVERAVNDGSARALSENKLRPATRPKIEITAFDEGTDLEFTMEVEILPDIEPMDFSTLELERLVPDVDDAEVTEALETMAKNQRRTEPLAKPRKAKNGDVLVIDFTGRVGGEIFEGGRGEKQFLELGSGSFIPGFEEQLVGIDAGQDVTVEVSFPDDYVQPDLAGKAASFAVTVREIREPVEASVDEEFAKGFGAASLDDLRGQMRERLSGQYAGLARQRLKRALLDQLAEAHDFELPPGMVDMEFDSIWPQVEKDREAGNLEEDDRQRSEAELRDEYRAISERRVRLGLLLAEVGQAAGVEVAQDEVTRAIMEEARRYPGQEQQVLEFYQKNPEALANLRAPLFEDKVIDHILGQAKVADRSISVADLLKLPEDGTPAKKKAAPRKKKAAAGKAAAGKAAAGKTAGKAAPKKTTTKKAAAKKRGKDG